MSLTKVQQSQISGSLAFVDNMSNADLTKQNRTLVDDLNALRTQIRNIQGTSLWSDTLSGSQDLADIHKAMVVNGFDAEFQGNVSGSGNFSVGGNITLAGNISSDIDEAKTLFSQLVNNDLTIGGAGGTGQVVLANTLRVMGDEVSGSTGGYLKFLGNGDVEVAGDLVVKGNQISGSVGNMRLLGNGDVEFANDVILLGNTIKSSDGTDAIQLLGDDVTVKGDLVVEDGLITLSNGASISSVAPNELTLTQDLVIVSNKLRVAGDQISGSAGGYMRLAGSSLVEFAGDVRLLGNSIQSSAGVDAITLSGQDVTVEGSLTVDQDMVVTGDLTVKGDVTYVNATNTYLKDTIIGIGFASGANGVTEVADNLGDRGFVFAVGDSEGGNVAAYWDRSASEFKLQRTTSNGLNPEEAALNIEGTDYIDFRAGIIYSVNGFSGSLTKLVNGQDYLLPGVGITLSTGSTGAITIGVASNSYAKGYFNTTHLTGDDGNVINFSSALGTLSPGENVDKNVDVYLNGALLAFGATRDVIAISTTSVTLNQLLVGELIAGDVITIAVRSLV